jgi:hypothetical protein
LDYARRVLHWNLRIAGLIEFERKLTIERTTTTTAYKMADNRAVGRIPYGYRTIDEEDDH